MWIGKENQPVSRDLNKMDIIPEIRIIKGRDDKQTMPDCN